MEWKDEYSLGIAEIDNQHKVLLRGFSAVEEAIGLGRGWSSVHFAIVELRDLAASHFAFEEALMRLYGYAELEEHAESHRNLLVKLQEIEHASIRTSAERDMVEFLRNWLTMHIQGADKGYARHILTGAAVVRSGRVAMACC
ncbi:MAG: bacteriohemerythrin [Sulfurisoma sp.]|nr:bacteriohemerythrin [Sulfurisoma sp.]